MTTVANPPAGVAWQRETDADGIVWLTFDMPGDSTNVLSPATLMELSGHLDSLGSPRGLVIRSGKSSGFVAGADVREFAKLENAGQAVEMVRAAHRIFDRLEALPFPTV